MIYKTSTMNQPLSFLAGDSLSEATTFATEESIFAGSKFFDTTNGNEFIWTGSAFVLLEEYIIMLSTDAKPATAPNKTRLLTVDNGTWWICFNNTWYAQ